jgi:uncharacterized protein (DUF433 family)
MEWKQLDRITFDPAVMGGKPCIRGMRVTVGMVVGMIASGHDRAGILALYPYLEPEDIAQVLSYAAWRSARLETAVGRA